MALTTNFKVWRILLAVFLLMSIVLTILFYFQTIFVTILIGISLIFITTKIIQLHRNLFHRRKQNRFLKALFLCFFVVISLAALYFLINHTLNEVEQIIHLTKQSPSAESTLFDIYYEKLHKFLPESITQLIFTRANLEKGRIFFLEQLRIGIPILTKQFLAGILIIPLLFYIYFRKGHMLLQQCYALIPAKFSRVVHNTLKDTKRELNDYFTGKLLQSTVIAIISITGFYFAGVKAWLFFGLLAGFLNIIPFLGPILGAVPPLFIALLDPSMTVVLGVLITIGVAQLVDNFYLQPFMLSGIVKMDPLLLILLVLAFARVAGPLGMILAVPIYSVYRITLRELYSELILVYNKK